MKKLIFILLFSVIAARLFAALSSPRQREENPQPVAQPVVTQPQSTQTPDVQPRTTQPRTTQPQTTQPRGTQKPATQSQSAQTTAIQLREANQSVASLVLATNRMMEVYNTLHQSGKVVFYSLKKLEFKENEIAKIQSDPYLGRYLSHNKDSLAVFAAVELFQERISDNLRQIVSHPDFLANKDKRAILAHLQGIGVVVSDDNRLYNFTFASKNAGVYEMRTSVMHFIKPETNRMSISDRTYQAFSNDGYTDIFLLDPKWSQYLLIGQVKTGRNSYECYADLLSFQNGVFIKTFESRVPTGNPANCVVFDKTGGTLRVVNTVFVFNGENFVRK